MVLFDCKRVTRRKSRKRRRGKATRGKYTKSCSKYETFGKKRYKRRFCRTSKRHARRVARDAKKRGTYKYARVKKCKARQGKQTTYCVYARKR